jgi:uncharacterized protein (DUF58 family)
VAAARLPCPLTVPLLLLLLLLLLLVVLHVSLAAAEGKGAVLGQARRSRPAASGPDGPAGVPVVGQGGSLVLLLQAARPHTAPVAPAAAAAVP